MHIRSRPKRSTEARVKNQKTHQKVAAKLRNNVAAETVRDTHWMIDAQYNRLNGSRFPDTLRVLAERNVAQTRELYEHSKNTFQAMLESWQKSFGSAGVALSRKMIDVSGRNMDTGFNFAMGLAGARNLGEVMELQADYWHKLGGALQIQAKTRAARRNS